MNCHCCGELVRLVVSTIPWNSQALEPASLRPFLLLPNRGDHGVFGVGYWSIIDNISKLPKTFSTENSSSLKIYFYKLRKDPNENCGIVRQLFFLLLFVFDFSNVTHVHQQSNQESGIKVHDPPSITSVITLLALFA